MTDLENATNTARKSKFVLLKPVTPLTGGAGMNVARQRTALDAALPRLPANEFARTRGARRRTRWLALLFVAVPTLLSAVYCFYLAAPMYVSSARFAIRGQSEAGAGTAFGKIMQGAGASAIAGLTDGFAVRDFLLSADSLEQLKSKIGFVDRMKRPRGDFLFNLKEDQHKEAMLRFYHKVVKVRFNMTEGIVSVDVYAFTPADAFLIARQLTDMAGEFSNEINRRATEETLRVAKEDVAKSKELVTNARLALTNWRKEHANLDLEVNAKMIQQIIGQLETQLTEAKYESEQLLSSGLLNSPRRKLA
jgi:capsular polysaccharide transport system permease protein